MERNGRTRKGIYIYIMVFDDCKFSIAHTLLTTSMPIKAFSYLLQICGYKAATMELLVAVEN